MARVSTDPADPAHVPDLAAWSVTLNGREITRGWRDPATGEPRRLVTADEAAGRVWYRAGAAAAGGILASAIQDAFAGSGTGRPPRLRVAEGIVRVRRVAVHDWPQGAPAPDGLRD